MKLGLLREEKKPYDKRVALTPESCKRLLQKYPELSITVERSAHRCFSDTAYEEVGATLVDACSPDAIDLLLGVKEVPISKLIPHKSYCFFSHTIKEQPYNQGLLKALVEQDIRMIDYECLVDATHTRLIGFGVFAGIVGAHHGLRTWIQKVSNQIVPQANACKDYKELIDNYKSITIPPHLKVIVTGRGRVFNGCLQVLKDLNLKEVTPSEFLTESFNEPIFVHLTSEDYYQHKLHKNFNRIDFKANPKDYVCTIAPYLEVAHVFLNGIFWNEDMPRFFELEDIQNPKFAVEVISDISCDINGSIPLTFRESSIADPIYGISKTTLQEVAPFGSDTIEVIAVSNMPCELPVDASESFSTVLEEVILPEFFKPQSLILEQATICEHHHLTPLFSYLTPYLNGTIS